MQRRLGRVPAWAWLAVIVVVGSAAFRFQLSRDSPAPWIFVDELIYSELAKSIAAGGDLFVRDVPVTGGYGVVYPLLISPAWALFDRDPGGVYGREGDQRGPDLACGGTRVPAGATSRRRRALALRCGARRRASLARVQRRDHDRERLLPALPRRGRSSLVLVLERPTLTRQIVLLGLLGVAYQTRPQAVALAAAALTAPLVQGLLGRRVRAAVVAQRTLYGIAGAARRRRGRRPVRARTSRSRRCWARIRSPARAATTSVRSPVTSSTTWPSSTCTSVLRR